MGNKWSKILKDLRYRLPQANQPDMVVVEKQRKEVVVMDTAVPHNLNIRKKKHENLKKNQVLKEELQKMWKVKVTVRAVTPK